MADWLKENGQNVTTGSEGDNAVAFANGEPVLDAGLSQVVFENGVGLGGGDLIIGGATVGFFETNESVSSFMAYQPGLDVPNAEGWYNFGIDTKSPPTYYLFGHRDTGTDTYSLCWWAVEDTNADTGSSYKTTVIWEDFGAVASTPSSPQAQDDPESGGSNADDETYGTDGNGDPQADHVWGFSSGDGHAYNFSTGTFSTTVKFISLQDGRGSNFPDNTDEPNSIVARGPEGDAELSYNGYGTTVDIQVNL